MESKKSADLKLILVKLALLVLAYFASQKLYYKSDFNLVFLCFLFFGFFSRGPSIPIIAALNVCMLFTNYSYSEYLHHFLPNELADHSAFKLVIIHVGIYSAYFGIVYALNGTKIILQKSAYALLFILSIFLLTYNLYTKQFYSEAALVFALPYLFNSLAMINYQMSGRRWTAPEILCNLTAFFTIESLPLPLLLTEHVPKVQSDNTNEQMIKIIKSLFLLFAVRQAIIYVFSNQQIYFFRYLAMTVLSYSAHPPSSIDYGFSNFPLLARPFLLISGFLFFITNFASLVYWKLIVLRFFHYDLGPQIRRPWAARTFYSHLMSWIYYDNEVFMRVFIEPLSRSFGRFFLKYKYLAISIFLFLTLNLYHALGNLHAVFLYTLSEFSAGYISMILSSFFISGAVYLSLRFERKFKNASLLRNLTYMILYAFLGYIGRDHFLVPLSQKLQIFIP